MSSNAGAFFVILAAASLLMSTAHAGDQSLVNATAQISVCGNGVREGGEQCDGGDTGARTCGYLGYDGGIVSCTPACEFDVSTCTTDAGTHATVEFSGENGGTYTAFDGADSVDITFLPNAYDEDFQVEVLSHDRSHARVGDPPSGAAFVGKMFQLVPIDEDGAIMQQVDRPATIVLTYADSDLGDTSEATLAPYRRDAGESTWHRISGGAIDTTDNQVTFTTTTFSQFAILGYPPPTPTPAPTSNPGGGGGGGGGGYALIPSPSSSPHALSPADLNKDGKVDIIDFSIMAFWWQRAISPGASVDLNHDGQLTLADFSILAFHWTG